MYTTPKTHCLRKKKRDLYGCEEEKPQKKAPDLFAIKIHKKHLKNVNIGLQKSIRGPQKSENPINKKSNNHALNLSSNYRTHFISLDYIITHLIYLIFFNHLEPRTRDSHFVF